jgi:peptide/nickel transport system ATP-binding protein/oligopeptide transport system ATP-binding protein
MEREDNLLLKVEDLKVYFRGNNAVSRAVDGINFEIYRGETVCLVGESGCGKTVTALSILGLVPSPPGEIAGGRIIFQGNDLLKLDQKGMQKVRGKQIAMIFQEPMTSLNPVFNIGYQIEESIRVHEKISKREAMERVIGLLRDVGIAFPEERIKDYPHQLSGGQRQRVMIAMALACNPKLLIADEPTTALDVTIQAQILKLFEEIQKRRNMSILYITHDLGTVARIANRVYVMYAGIIVEVANVLDIFRSPRHPYTKGLLASLPSRAKKGERLYSIPGSVPDPALKPSGCPFHPRCNISEASCKENLPEMYQFGPGHIARCPVAHKMEFS